MAACAIYLLTTTGRSLGLCTNINMCSIVGITSERGSLEVVDPKVTAAATGIHCSIAPAVVDFIASAASGGCHMKLMAWFGAWSIVWHAVPPKDDRTSHWWTGQKQWRCRSVESWGESWFESTIKRDYVLGVFRGNDVPVRRNEFEWSSRSSSSLV